MEQVYIALGSNLGDKEKNLEAAIGKVAEKCVVVNRSSIYETAPWGYLEQDSFLNMVLEVRSELAPRELLAFLKKAELDLGRVPNFRNGPRVIDMDILFYGNLCMDEPDLVIPHPRMQERAFVLVPLVEIAPDLQHPATQQRVDQYLVGLDLGGIMLYKKTRNDQNGD